MSRWLLDVNIVLDFLLGRAPFADEASLLWAAAERGEIQAVVAAHGVTTAFYVAARERDAAFARRLVADLLLVPAIAAVDGTVLRRAVALDWPDFEDAVCAAAAEATRCDFIVSRDPRGFRGSPVPVLDPRTALSTIRGWGTGGVSEMGVEPYGEVGSRSKGARRRRRPRS